MRADAMLLRLPLLLLLGGGAASEGAAPDAGAGIGTEQDAEEVAAATPPPPPSPPLCPTSSTHLQCDAARCLRYEDIYGVPGDAAGECSRHCVEPAPTCLHRKYVCDGIPDCEDGADEAGCVQCSLDAFPCDGVCQRRELICDPAFSHCRPAADEASCSGASAQCPERRGVASPRTALANLTCDGVPDCPGGRDERSCGAQHHCQGGAFYCDGRCLRASRRCDGVRHCEDGADELNCPASLHVVAIVHKNGENVVTKRECFDCGNGRCVSPSVKCDGVDDCGNARDEKRCFTPVCSDGRGRNCVATKCTEQGIPCSSGYRCGRLKWACDGHPHCDAASDEPADCYGPPKVYFCRGAGADAEPLPAATWCDGRADCPGPRPHDEENCPSEPPLANVYCSDNRTGHGAFQGGHAVQCPAVPRLIHCHDGTPRLETTRCDGVADCPGAEDEEGCGRCYDGAVLCDGRCVMASRRCDGYFDCSDGADERGCLDDLVLASAFFHPRVCGPGHFDCGNRCVSERHVCDGVRDCDNQADEANCNACRGGSVACAGRCVRVVAACAHEWPQCPGPGRNASQPQPSGLCDGVPDCADGHDEAAATCASEAACSAGLFCDGACRPRSAVCDAVRDCSDGRDEADCPDGVANTTTRESWRRVNHRVEFTWTYSSVFTAHGTTTNVTTVVNDTTAVTTTSVQPPPPDPAPLPCPTTTTPEPTTTPELAPTPAPPLRGHRPRKRGGGGGGGRRMGQHAQQQQLRQQRQQQQQQRQQRQQRARKQRKQSGEGDGDGDGGQQHQRRRHRKQDSGAGDA